MKLQRNLPFGVLIQVSKDFPTNPIGLLEQNGATAESYMACPVVEYRSNASIKTHDLCTLYRLFSGTRRACGYRRRA